MLTIILQMLFPFLDFFWKKYAHDEQQKKDYMAFLEIMSRKGVQSALNRLSAQEQVNAVNDLWKKEKANNEP